MSQPNEIYTGRDIAFIIPTKDRPKKLKNLLDSLAAQDEVCERVIVVDGGKSVKDVVIGFSDRLPVEYYECRPPGQIRQRNMGISLLDGNTPLVGSFDDDIVLESNSLKEMIAFWNRCETHTAGVSFNIVNGPEESRPWIKCLLGLSAREQGRVLRSGMTTSNTHVKVDLRSEWLCGGATIWKQQILMEFPHREIPIRWATSEDLIFSYPIRKKYPLYVCADAQARHEHEFDYRSTKKNWFHGFTQTIMIFYFVASNKDLSKKLFLWTLLVRIAGKLVLGACTFRRAPIEFAIGQMQGAVNGLTAIIRGRDMFSIFNDKRL